MDLVTDFLLLAASGTACLYCWVLSKKLKGLMNAEGGFGAGIAALSRSSEEMKNAIAETKLSADEAAARLESQLERADEKAAELQQLIDQLAEMGGSISDHAETATKNYIETLTPFMDEAQLVADRLLKAVEGAPAETPLEVKNSIAKSAKTAKAKPSRDEDDDLEFVETPSEAPPRRRRAKAGAAA